MEACGTSTTFQAGLTLKGGQLEEVYKYYRYMQQHPEIQYVVSCANRNNKRGAFKPVAIPEPLLDQNGEEVAQACCWDFHIFVATRDRCLVPYIECPSKLFQVEPVTLEYDQDGCRMYYLHARFLRGNKAQLGNANYHIQIGLTSDVGKQRDAVQLEQRFRIPITSFWIHPITTNATTNPNQVERNHYLSQPASIGVICGLLRPLSPQILETLDLLAAFNTWYKPRNYGPKKTRIETPRLPRLHSPRIVSCVPLPLTPISTQHSVNTPAFSCATAAVVAQCSAAAAALTRTTGAARRTKQRAQRRPYSFKKPTHVVARTPAQVPAPVLSLPDDSSHLDCNTDQYEHTQFDFAHLQFDDSIYDNPLSDARQTFPLMVPSL
jgi:hypothetical protein